MTTGAEIVIGSDYERIRRHVRLVEGARVYRMRS